MGRIEDLEANPVVPLKTVEAHQKRQTVASHRANNDALRRSLLDDNPRLPLFRVHSVLIDILEELREQSEWVKEQHGKV